MNDDRWIPAAQALELIASRFALAKKLDAVLAREEAKTAIIGDLASGRLPSCPKGCLTSTLESEKGRPGDFRYCELDADGNASTVSMEVQYEGEYVFIPSEFWEDFRDPAAGASANWHDGDFSFRLATPSRTTFVGEVRCLYLDRASAEQIGTLATDTTTVVKTGRPGRPDKGKALYLHELERRIKTGELESTLADQAKALSSWLHAHHPNGKQPALGTIENNIREIFYNAAMTTK